MRHIRISFRQDMSKAFNCQAWRERKERPGAPLAVSMCRVAFEGTTRGYPGGFDAPTQAYKGHRRRVPGSICGVPGSILLCRAAICRVAPASAAKGWVANAKETFDAPTKMGLR
jgi:hypothetical protein